MLVGVGVSILLSLLLGQLIETFAGVADGLGSLALDLGPYHEAANVRLAPHQKIVSVRSLGFAAGDADKVVNIESVQASNTVGAGCVSKNTLHKNNNIIM